MNVVIDVINGDDFVIATEIIKKEASEEKEEIVLDDRKLQKQVININGEIVTVFE